MGYGDLERRGDDTDEMGDNLKCVDLGDGFIPSKLVAGWYHNCVLGSNQIKCWGYPMTVISLPFSCASTLFTTRFLDTETTIITSSETGRMRREEMNQVL